MLESFISNYNLEDIKQIEETQDKQFLVLQRASKFFENKPLFVFLVIQNALLSYQLSSSGENRWEEFSEYSVKNQKFIDKTNLLDWWTEFLVACKGNRRLLNMKLKRLEKTIILYDKFSTLDIIEDYYNNMKKLNLLLANKMNQNHTAKTIVFAVKMYGYISRIVFDKFVSYPMEIGIPIDSRITKIYEIETKHKKFTNKQIEEYFIELSKKYKIPPLHLDSLLWIKYWKEKG